MKYVNHKAAIECISNGEVTWTKNGKRLHPQYIETPYKILIESVVLEDNGTYVCNDGSNNTSAHLFVGSEYLIESLAFKVYQ